MIIALAGRRVDPEDAENERFPLRNIPTVRTRVQAVLEQQGATAVVSSAACGADLIALSEAGSLGLRRRIVLPFDRKRFRKTSVIDRPGDWGGLYDEILDEVESAGDLVVLGVEGDAAYSATNDSILDEAEALAQSLGACTSALLIWDGKARSGHDLTWEFGEQSRKRGLPVIEVSTV